MDDFSFDGTGITGLDMQLEGGVPAGTTILLFAEPGAGSSVFCNHFVQAGLKNKEEIIYFITEHSVDRTINSMKDFGWNVQEYLDDRLQFIDAYSPRYSDDVPETLQFNPPEMESAKKGRELLELLKETIEKERSTRLRFVAYPFPISCVPVN
ncbi:MAG: ATPase domain-containing protein [Euryarchaeota archaeon]|nr:ATPase domain-containing protein [Euryarchaeota archaeon]